MDWSSRRPPGSESRWASGAWASGQNNFSRCVKSVETPNESLMKAGIYSKVEVRTLGHIPHVVTFWAPIITIRITSCYFLFFKEKGSCGVIALKFSHSDSCPDPAISWFFHHFLTECLLTTLHFYILILFFFSNRQWFLKHFFQILHWVFLCYIQFLQLSANFWNILTWTMVVVYILFP